jgi:hypothetical protein
MKKKIVLAAIAFMSIMQTWARENEEPVLKEVKLTAAFDRILISSGVDVLLIEGESQTVTIQGPQKYVDAITVREKDGELIIGSKREGGSARAVVYLPVNHLKKIQVNGEARIYTVGMIHSPELLLNIMGNCDFGINNQGKITIVHSDEFEVEYKWLDNRKLVNELVTL